MEKGQVSKIAFKIKIVLFLFMISILFSACSSAKNAIVTTTALPATTSSSLAPNKVLSIIELGIQDLPTGYRDLNIANNFRFPSRNFSGCSNLGLLSTTPAFESDQFLAPGDGAIIAEEVLAYPSDNQAQQTIASFQKPDSFGCYLKNLNGIETNAGTLLSVVSNTTPISVSDTGSASISFELSVKASLDNPGELITCVSYDNGGPVSNCPSVAEVKIKVQAFSLGSYVAILSSTYDAAGDPNPLSLSLLALTLTHPKALG